MAFFQFPNLARYPEIRHGVFTRNGGHSDGPYRSLNTSLSVGDDPAKVQENRRKISRCLDSSQLVFIRQDHGKRTILYSRKEDAESAGHPADPPVGDAVVTDLKGKFLVVQVADCQSLLLYDPCRKVVANVHSGWRGSVDNVVGHTVKTMERKMGCRSRDMIAGIGPSLGPCCAEFINYKREIPPKFWKYKDLSHHFDFWSLSIAQLVETGVLRKNIHLSKICTKCNTAQFFSYRGEGKTGRFAAVIGLK
jgi:YfiH family protein